MLHRRVGRAELRFTDAGDGDLRTDASARAAIHPAPWSLLRQVHGGRVVVVDAPGAHTGEDADGAVTRVDEAPLVVMTADCAPIGFADDGGDVVGVAHAGWRGLVAGVVANTVDAMHAAGARTPISAFVGPCIHAECYEFGGKELDVVAARFGDEVRARTADGRPALDVVAAVRAALADADIGSDRVELVDVCTACGHDSAGRRGPGTHWSHRARGDVERQGVVVWRSAPTS